MAAVEIVVGVAMLLFGRRLFWVFVGGVGFAGGMALGTQVLAEQPDWIVLSFGLFLGLGGALLALLLQRVAVAVAGFVAGGYAAFALAEMLQWGEGPWLWGTALIGGVFGAVVAGALFNWALILLSVLVGANLVVQGAALEPRTAGVVFIVLVLAGVALQGRALAKTARVSTTPDTR
jgi:hypothetical protein